MTLRIVVELLVAALSAGIVLVHLSLYAGLVMVAARRRHGVEGAAGGGLPTVSIIVPARDEADNLPRLFTSLERQTRNDFEMVFINDRSRDATPELIAAFADRNGARVKRVDLTEADTLPHCNPKQNALAFGTRRASGKLLLFTDADCDLPPTWVERIVSCFSDETCGLVIGPIVTRQDEGIVSRFHAFDHLFKYSYTAGSAGIGLATGGFGNNLALRASVLAAVGGFESLGFTTTEDAALIAAVRRLGTWRITALLSRESLVVTAPLRRLGDIAAQEVRWHVGGLFSKDRSSRLSYSYLMLFLTFSVVSAPFAVLFPPLAIAVGTSFVTMGLMAVCAGLAAKPRGGYWGWFVPSLLGTMIFNSYLTIRALTGRVVTWKGSTLTD